MSRYGMMFRRLGRGYLLLGRRIALALLAALGLVVASALITLPIWFFARHVSGLFSVLALGTAAVIAVRWTVLRAGGIRSGLFWVVLILLAGAGLVVSVPSLTVGAVLIAVTATAHRLA